MFNCKVVRKQSVVVEVGDLLPGGLVYYIVVVGVLENQVTLVVLVSSHVHRKSSTNKSLEVLPRSKILPG